MKKLIIGLVWGGILLFLLGVFFNSIALFLIGFLGFGIGCMIDMMQDDAKKIDTGDSDSDSDSESEGE